jgi:hypothetical protein
MKSKLITAVSLLGAAAFCLLVAGPGLATEEMARAEDMACTVCHDKPGSKLMTDRGLYYEAMGSLDGYDDLVAAFQECTTCHVKKPGSKKLTARGRRYAWAVGDMEALEEWLLSQHPQPSAEEVEKGPQGDPKGGEGGSGG